MNRRKTVQSKRNTIIAVALILSVILYIAGVYSGLYANRIIEEKTKIDIENLKNETNVDLEKLQAGTEKQISSLEDYISFLENNLRGMQLEQTFVETLSHDEMCDFSDITMDYLYKELNEYWSVLPFRIEEYERTETLTEEYLSLKQQYTQVSIRTWALARNMHEKCNSSLVSGLHFYSIDCANCVKQGEELDLFKDELERKGIDVMIFTVDINSDEPIIRFLRESYNITETPALLINDHLMQGSIFSTDEIMEVLE